MEPDAIVQALLGAARGVVRLRFGARANEAWPMLEPAAMAAAEEAAREVESAASAAKRVGKRTRVLVMRQNGDLEKLPARYELREADEVIASHDPARGFQPSIGYPADVQERAYQADPYEQAKVTANALEFEPALVVNTNPDAVNGPPVLSSDGYALGGNSRVMTMRLLYATMPEKAEALRQYLAEHASEAGFRASDVAAFREPLLVRVLELSTQGSPLEKMQLLVRQLNESLTQAMDPRTAQVALARRLSDESVERLAADLEPDETLNDYLGKRKSQPLIESLRKDGVFNRRNANLFFRKDATALNQDGRKRVADVLVGKLVDNADLLRDLRPVTVEGLARSAPYLLTLKKYGKAYDLKEDVKKAVAALNDMERRIDSNKFHVTTLDPKMSDSAFEQLFAQQSLFGDDAVEEIGPRAKRVLEAMIRRRGSAQLSDVFRKYVDAARKNQSVTQGFFATDPPIEPAKLFETMAQSEALSQRMAARRAKAEQRRAVVKAKRAEAARTAEQARREAAS